MARAYLAPCRFRFGHPDDIATFGDDWYLYSEPEITSMPARALAELEDELGMPLVDVMNGLRETTTMGDLGASWLAIKLDPVRGEKCPPFAEYDVRTMLMEWEPVPVGQGKEPSPASTAGPTPTAALPTLPAVAPPG